MEEGKNALLPFVSEDTNMDRNDVMTAVKVNHGIALATFEGTGAAATYMAKNGIPFDVAHRVLICPRQRRVYDWQ